MNGAQGLTGLGQPQQQRQQPAASGPGFGDWMKSTAPDDPYQMLIASMFGQGGMNSQAEQQQRNQILQMLAGMAGRTA